MTDTNQELHPEKPLLLQKGKYVFIDELKEELTEGNPVPYFSAKAILILDSDGIKTGRISTVNVSDLILKQSSYIDETGKTIEAHKLYTWPRNLGSTVAWTAEKREFLNQYILNFPVEVISLQESNGVTWKYITPENFKDFPADIIAAPDFQEFAENREDYFFLRRPVSSPQ